MKMEELIARINELAHKAKAQGLTEAETAERETLRKEYLAVVRHNLMGQLDNTYIVDKNGNKTKLKSTGGPKTFAKPHVEPDER